MKKLEEIGRRIVAANNDLKTVECPDCGGRCFYARASGADVLIRCGSLIGDRENPDEECGYSHRVLATSADDLPAPVWGERKKPRVRILYDSQKDS